MIRWYVLRRLLQVVPTVIGIVLVAFVLVHIAPGDPVMALAGDHGDAAYYAFMRHRFGLDQPLPRQMLTFFTRMLTGDFGFSYVEGRSTLLVISERIPATSLLGATALLIAVVVSVPLGAIAAQRPETGPDTVISGVALALFSAPAFWLAQMSILCFALGVRLFPVQGMTTAGADQTGAAHVLDVARHLALPALVLAAQEIAVLVRLARSGLIDELARDHVRTARAKGVAELSVLVRHAFPRALVPVLAVVGTRIGHLIAGAAVVEVVFGWPGMGRLLMTALQTRDTPVLLGLFIVVSLSVVVVNLVTDLVHATIDPRVRLG
ncbi:MAG: ABC transporter permease [Gemmatimonadota bacterium]|nr:ABC transporter permease [Gemmatimonadota bacterium]